MTPPLTPLSLPLAADAHGVVRVAGTRVPLATVLRAFRGGATPEEIVLQFDTLTLADVYAVVAAYLRDRPAFDQHLRTEDAADETAWRAGWADPQRAALRDRLTARRDALIKPGPGIL